MRRAFFANCASKTGRPLSVATRFALLNRSVVPILQHRDTRWPPCAQRQQDIDTLQRRMISSIVRAKPTAGEPAADFVRRRNRETTRHMNRIGKWSTKHLDRVLAWDSHLRRPRNSSSWAASLLDYKGEDWLRQRRLTHSRGSGSRTGTRAAPGYVATRWHDGIAFAKANR